MTKYELYHHGIKGQQWGVRNGPPYPLSRSEHNKVTGGNDTVYQGHRKSKKHFKLTNQQKRILASIAITGAFTLASYYASNNGDLSALPKDIVQAINNIRTNHSKILRDANKRAADQVIRMDDLKSDFYKHHEIKNRGELAKLKNLSKEAADDITVINEGYGIVERTTNNCAQCSLAYVMRQNGYNVVANNRMTDLSNKTGGVSHNAIAAALGVDPSKYIKRQYGRYSDLVSTPKQSVKALENMLAISEKRTGKKDGLYMLSIFNPTLRSGHSVVAQVENGVTYIVDAQYGSKVTASKYFSQIATYTPMRILKVPDFSQSMPPNDICQYLRSGVSS